LNVAVIDAVVAAMAVPAAARAVVRKDALVDLSHISVCWALLWRVEVAADEVTVSAKW